MSKKQLFISFEGVDGSGKSTQVELLSNQLKKKRIDHIVTREPGGSTFGEWVRSFLMESRCNIDIQTEVLLFAAARNEHCLRTIIPALEKGQWVISDRFIDSSYAYQGSRSPKAAPLIEAVHQALLHLPIPDVTFLLLPGKQQRNIRMEKRIKDRFETDYDDVAITNIYCKLYENNKQRIHCVDSDAGIEQIASKIWQQITQQFLSTV